MLLSVFIKELLLPCTNSVVEGLQLAIEELGLLFLAADVLVHVASREGAVVDLVADEGDLITQLLFFQKTRLLVVGDLLVDRVEEPHALFLVLLEEDDLDVVDSPVVVLDYPLKFRDQGLVFGLSLQTRFEQTVDRGARPHVVVKPVNLRVVLDYSILHHMGLLLTENKWASASVLKDTNLLCAVALASAVS